MPYRYVVAPDTPGAHWDNLWNVHTYPSNGTSLPAAVAERVAPPHSWGALVQQVINGDKVPAPTGRPPALRAHQIAPVGGIVGACATGAPGFALSYPTGSGKTYMAVAAANEIRPRRVLVIAPKALVGGWRAAISAHSTTPTQWVVINPQRLWRLFTLGLDAPVPLRALRTQERVPQILAAGQLLIDFDMVVADEAQFLATSDSGRSELWRRLTGWRDDGHAPDAFTLFLSATPWSRPSELVPAAHLIAHLAGAPTPSRTVCSTEFLPWLSTTLGLQARVERDGRWRWQDHDQAVRRITGLLYGGPLGAAATATSLGLPAQERELVPIHLTDAEAAQVDQAWQEWARDHGVDPGSGEDAWVRQMARIESAKARAVADLVALHVQEGHQVIVPAWLTSTVEELRTHITRSCTDLLGTPSPDRYMWVMALTGQDDTQARDAKIRAFQSGRVPVVICSITEAISLHAGQRNGGQAGPDGAWQDATLTPRVTIAGGLLTGGKKMLQAEGRATRDGQAAPTLYPVASGTRDEDAMAQMFASLANSRALTLLPEHVDTDADLADLTRLATTLDQAWERTCDKQLLNFADTLLDNLDDITDED